MALIQILLSRFECVRLVIDEIGGKDIPEIIAINKVDIAESPHHYGDLAEGAK
jgi:50S ribosomal subunit-associated GTPase HflX